MILKDLARLTDALLTTDPIDENSIVAGYCAFLQRLDTEDEIFHRADLETRMRDLKAELEQRFGNQVMANGQLRLSIDVYEAYCKSAEEVVQEWPEDMLEHGDVVEYTGAAAGVLIKLERNEAVHNGGLRN